VVGSEGQWEVRVLKVLGKETTEFLLLATGEAREHGPLGETTLRHACHMPPGATCHVVRQVKYAGKLLQTPGGVAMDHRLTHGHAVHLVHPFVARSRTC
jgi:hypothetical protein